MRLLFFFLLVVSTITAQEDKKCFNSPDFPYWKATAYGFSGGEVIEDGKLNEYVDKPARELTLGEAKMLYKLFRDSSTYKEYSTRCSPTYNMGIVFYDSKGKPADYINICLTCAKIKSTFKDWDFPGINPEAQLKLKQLCVDLNLPNCPAWDAKDEEELFGKSATLDSLTFSKLFAGKWELVYRTHIDASKRRLTTEIEKTADKKQNNWSYTAVDPVHLHKKIKTWKARDPKKFKPTPKPVGQWLLTWEPTKKSAKQEEELNLPKTYQVLSINEDWLILNEVTGINETSDRKRLKTSSKKFYLKKID